MTPHHCRSHCGTDELPCFATPPPRPDPRKRAAIWSPCFFDLEQVRVRRGTICTKTMPGLCPGTSRSTDPLSFTRPHTLSAAPWGPPSSAEKRFLPTKHYRTNPHFPGRQSVTAASWVLLASAEHRRGSPPTLCCGERELLLLPHPAPRVGPPLSTSK